MSSTASHAAALPRSQLMAAGTALESEWGSGACGRYTYTQRHAMQCVVKFKCMIVPRCLQHHLRAEQDSGESCSSITTKTAGQQCPTKQALPVTACTHLHADPSIAGIPNELHACVGAVWPCWVDDGACGRLHKQRLGDLQSRTPHTHAAMVCICLAES